MSVISKLRLYSECFKLAGISGLIACTKYLFGRLELDEIPSDSSYFQVGAAYE